MTARDAAPLAGDAGPSAVERSRAARLERIMGTAPAWAGQFAEPLRGHVDRNYQRFVVPLIRTHWPELLDGQPGPKLRFLATRLYAAAAYTALFCSEHKPLLFSPLPVVAALPLPAPLLARLGQGALAVVAGSALAAEQRRIVLVGAYIATVDHLFDHLLDHLEPLERAALVHGLVEGTVQPEPGPQALVRALQDAMEEDLSPLDHLVYDRAIAEVVEWAEAEARGLLELDDPEGICHRGAGVRGTIDGLLFPLHRWADEPVRQWMVSVSLFVQVMDDWLDEEDDRAIGRVTPATLGRWGEAEVAAHWERTVRGIEALGRGWTRYGAFLRDVYLSQMIDVAHAMAHGLAS